MTHGLCGKEGAMVFKRVLKGIGRLMLTTAVMCGVGLFLCSSEVKAVVNVEVAAGTEANGNLGAFIVTVTAEKGDDISNIKEIQLFDDTPTPLYTKTIDEAVDTTSDGITRVYNITPGEFINSSAVIAKDFKNGQQATIKKAAVKYINSTEVTKESGSVTLSSKPIYKVSADKANTFSAVSYDPSSSYVYEVGGENRQYGYENETFIIKHGDASYTNYYMLVKECPTDSNSFAPNDNSWQEGIKEIKSGTLGPDKSYEVAYLPKVIGISVSSSSNTTNTKLLGTVDPKSLSAISDSTQEISTDITFGINSFISSTESSSDKSAIQGYYNIECTPSLASADTPMNLNIPNDSVTQSSFNLKMQLNNTASGGAGKVVIKLKLGNLTVASVDLPIVLNCKPTKLLLQNVPISLIAGGEKKTLKIFKGVEPSGANQDPSSYTASLNVATPGVLDGNEKFNPSTGEITVKASSTAAAGSNTEVTLTLTDKFNNDVSQSFYVKIISFSKDKTISSINNSNKNYITYNKDKGYSLDIKQLIIDNAKDTSDNTVKITKDQIIEVKVGSTSCSEGTWKPSEAALNQKVSCKINGVKIEESDGLKVSAYPMPTATYSSSNRTLSVKIPTKVATAYSDDNNIRQSKGFKLILEDSSGNTLYEYTDSKYQSVLSSSSDSTVSYTVTASDIEGMVTSAASNGKFSADTTSVKFKVIPMGYKQSSTSDETIKAKDEIAGKTDAVTVYKVSASGTNFTSSAAYGLDGQTVSITATPNSGYSFKQWSDGNTSNPRQVKVSASGTRSFQAVAGDRVANSTGAGGTDNSELYDDVPKTAESNSAIWLIVFMVFAVMGTTYALYLQLRAANSKHDR